MLIAFGWKLLHTGTDLEDQRSGIQAYANERYSWTKVGGITKSVYSQLAQN